MNEKNIAAQLFTLREFLQTPEEIGKTLKKVKNVGYQAVQVSGLGPIGAGELKHLADEAGIRICASHVSYDRLQNDLVAVVGEHKLWDCKYVGLGMMPKHFWGSREGYLTFAREMGEIAKKIYDRGLKFVYHNHNFELERFGDSTGLDLLFENTDPETFGFEMDTYWIQAGGGNPVEWIYKLKGRMEVVHFKDMAMSGWDQLFAEIGEGNLNWKAIIDACRETGVEWYAVEQDKCRRDPFDSLQISLNYLRKFI